MQVRPEPGRSEVLDLNMNGLVRFGERAVVVHRFLPLGAGSAEGCVFSVQVFDQGTGWTQGFMAP
ncbi:MAG: hypothetical protein U0R19_35920 [Bryobacteraceae bacterium]